MKIPDMCYQQDSFDSDSAGWYVHNSIYVKDIYPVFREPGGGVTENALLKNVEDALDRAMTYTEASISTAKKHRNKLVKAKMNGLKNDLSKIKELKNAKQ